MHRHTLHMQVLASSRLKNRGEEFLLYDYSDSGEGRETVYKYYQIIYVS